jgi:DNA-binding MarR family transcriptional regulator
VRAAGRDRDDGAGRGGDPLDLARGVLDVDRQLAAIDALHLERLVAVQHRRADRAGMTKQAMAQLVAHLEEHGYVERVPDPGDRRAKLVRATARGRDVFAVARELVDEVEARLTERLGAARPCELRTLLQALDAAL